MNRSLQSWGYAPQSPLAPSAMGTWSAMTPPPRLRTVLWRTALASLLVTTGILLVAQPGTADVLRGPSTEWSIMGTAAIALAATGGMVALAMRRPKAH